MNLDKKIYFFFIFFQIQKSMTFTPRLKATTDVAQVRIKTVLSRNGESNLNLSILSLTQFFLCWLNRQMIFLNLGVCNFAGPDDCYLFESLVPRHGLINDYL